MAAGKSRSQKPRAIRVGILGWGTIGSGVIRLLRGSQEALSSRLGAPLELARVADLDLKRKREVRVPKRLLTSDASAVLKDPEIDVVVELIGGLEPARTFVLEAIAQGKAVVTANKALLAHHGREIFAAAEKAGAGACRSMTSTSCAVSCSDLRMHYAELYLLGYKQGSPGVKLMPRCL